MEWGVDINCDEEEWEYCQRDCLHTIFLLTGRGGGLILNFGLGGILPKRLFTNVPLPVNKWGG